MAETVLLEFQFATQDSFLLDKKGDFPFAEPAAELPTADTSKANLKKKFIDSQIKTKIVEAPGKGKKQETTQKAAKIDSAVLQTELPEYREGFRFGDLVRTNTKEKEVTVTKTPAKPGTLFAHHELELRNTSGIALNRDTSVWVFFVLMILLSGFTWIRVFYNKTLRQLFLAVVNSGAAAQMFRDENMLLQRASVLLTILFNLVLAFFVYEISVAFEWSSDYLGTGFGRFIIFALGVSFLYAFKFIILRITGYVFRSDKPVSAYIFNVFFINNVLGIILLPLIIGIAFLPSEYSRPVIYISLFLIIAGFLYRLIRGIFIGFGHSEFSRFHLLLYVCALEISPIVICLKWFN